MALTDGRPRPRRRRPTAYGLCRPPGHHTARSMYGGYCFFNNAAIAAEAIAAPDRRAGGHPRRRLPPRQRVAADLLAPRRRALRVDPRPSRWRVPVLPGPRADETGEGEGAGENLNLPAPGRARPTRTTSRRSIAPARRSPRRPGSIVVVSLGFDTYGLDPIGDFALTTDVYHEVGRRVAALGRRLVILQEGGYHRPSLGENARAWLRGAEGRDRSSRCPAAGFGPAGRSPASRRARWRPPGDRARRARWRRRTAASRVWPSIWRTADASPMWCQ